MSSQATASPLSFPATARQEPVIEVRDLCKLYPVTRGLLRRQVAHVKAVDGVSFELQPGETLALVGESGCGKTTTGRCVMRAVEPSSGSVLFRPQAGAAPVDIVGLNRQELRYTQRYMGMIFQDPYSSLNPRMTVLDIIGEPFVTRNLVKNRSELQDRVAQLLRDVRLDPDLMQRYPHAFSGGQRQRIAIARALALNPRFVVADEPVSALDVSVQAQILRLLREIQLEHNLTYLFISHNLSVVEYISDRVAVMYVGKIVEVGRTEEVFRRPAHPYTEALLSAVPTIQSHDAPITARRILEGEVADPANVPSGCAFHPRCVYAAEICRSQEPPQVDIAPAGQPPHVARCHFARELNLQGVTPA
jgi:peptide/nickel transport system ATP-binding protein